jgi:hypothetical protein
LREIWEFSYSALLGYKYGGISTSLQNSQILQFKEALKVKGGDWKAKMNSIKVAAHREYKPISRCHL